MNKNRNLTKVKGGRSNGNPKGVLNSSCTISEAVQIANGVVEDALSDYHQKNGNMQVAMSVQIELIKEMLYKANITTEEEFKERYLQEVDKINQARQKQIEEFTKDEDEEEEIKETPKEKPDVQMKTSVGDIEIKQEA